MKLLVVLALVAAAAAAPAPQGSPAQSNQDVQILRYETDNDGVGNYNFAFEQSDNTKRQEQGELKNVGTDNESISVEGSYSWQGPDGVIYAVTYTADENGFQPTIKQGPGGGIPPSVSSTLLR